MEQLRRLGKGEVVMSRDERLADMKAETVKSVTVDGVLYEVVRETRMVYPSDWHSAHGYEGKEKNAYYVQSSNPDDGREYGFTPMRYRQAISWFNDKEIMKNEQR